LQPRKIAGLAVCSSMYNPLTRPQCSLRATGLDISGRAEGNMDQSQHDELAALFAQRMNFATGDQAQQIQYQTFVEPVPMLQISEKHEEAPIHYASAHYNHSYHIRHETLSEPSRSPPPPYHETMLTDHMAQTLRENSIDPSALLPNQLHLYANADLDQRLRLLELWRISPPSYSPEEQIYGAQNPTNLAQEEASARQRYEAQNPAFDTHIEPPRITPIRQAGEPAWPPAARMRAASIASSKPTAHHMSDAEPYIMDGYQAGSQPHLQSASSIEPVYAASSGLWPGQQQQGVDDQYGAFMQIRNHADWEAMNERIARERFGMMGHSGGNDGDGDMIM
jgi:hypothetical protein